jgi:CRISPR-associated protein Csb2
MFAVEIELLTERWAATQYNDRGEAEWPPHPARVFSALVAEHVDAELDDAKRAAEVAALDWLAAQVPPLVIASPEASVARRTVAPHFVPVNDVGAISQPDSARARLEEALEARRLATDPKAQQKADKAVEKARETLASVTASAVAVPIEPSKGTVRSATTVLPERRVPQPRTFPSLTPSLPRFALAWPDATPGEHQGALDSLMGRVVRIGHSSTLVYARCVPASALERLRVGGAVTYRPDEENGSVILRVPGTGQRARLTEAFAKHGGNDPRVLPARFVRYSDSDQPASERPGNSIFATDFVVLARVGGPRLPIVAAPHVANALRRAVIARAPEPKSAFLTGHLPDGAPAEGPRLAIVPLPFVGSRHADGSIMGVAMVVPRGATADELAALGATLRDLDRANGDEDSDERPIVVKLGDAGVLELSPQVWGRTSATLQPATWGRAARRWATATPLVLDRNPGDLHDRDPGRRARAFEEAEAIARLAIERVLGPNAPAISYLDVGRSSILPGSAKPRDFGRYPVDERKAPRVLVHVRVEFERPLVGPLVAGAGRYQGMGLFLPVDDHTARRTSR